MADQDCLRGFMHHIACDSLATRDGWVCVALAGSSFCRGGVVPRGLAGQGRSRGVRTLWRTGGIGRKVLRNRAAGPGPASICEPFHGFGAGRRQCRRALRRPGHSLGRDAGGRPGVPGSAAARPSLGGAGRAAWRPATGAAHCPATAPEGQSSGLSGAPARVPPSITMLCPVMKLPAGEARNTAAPAISSGSPIRCSGVSLVRFR